MKKIQPYWNFIFNILNNKQLLEHLNNSILLNTIPKSGTNYLRLILINYFCNYYSFINLGEGGFNRIGYFQLHSNIFPHVRGDLLNGLKNLNNFSIHPSNLIYGRYSDFMYDHGHFSDYLLSNSWLRSKLAPKKTILLYRNPLDQMISWYFYWYKNNRSKKTKSTNFWDVLDLLVIDYAKHYKRTIKLKKYLGEISLLISYEEIIQYPVDTSIKILDLLELPINKDLLKQSLFASSKKEIKKEENKTGRTIHTKKVSSGSFIRSGKIGDWKNYIDNKTLEIIKQKFIKKDIALDEFDSG